MADSVRLRPLTLLVGGLLLFDALGGAIRLVTLLSGLSTRVPVEILFILACAAVSASLGTAGWLVITRRPAAPPLARMSVVASAVLATLEIGFALAPSDVDPSLRWPTVAFQWIYALVLLALLRVSSRGSR